MKIYVYFLLAFCFAVYTPGFTQNPDDQIQIPNRTNGKAQQEKPYLILISADGFRYDYFQKFGPRFLNKMRKKGVSAKAMIPSYPSVTFPNHYTLVTGLIPPHHGLVGNRMYDPETGEHYSLSNQKAVKNPDWYGGTPLWSLAESQDLLSACFYWPGSEAKIAGYYPSYYYPYSENKGIEERVNSVVDWLKLPKKRRPHLITFYFPDIDQAGHRVGPDGLETERATKYVDAAVEKLVQAVDKTGLPVNFVFLSDHGMIKVDTEHPIKLPQIARDSLVLVNNGVYTSIFVKDKAKIKSIYKRYKAKATAHYKVYLKKEVPPKYKFSAQYDRHHRIGDIVLMAEAPYYFQSENRLVPRGAHGYLPEDTPEMKTIFMAWGPDIQKGQRIKAFNNIHVFPLLAELLGLKYDATKIDGDDRLVQKVLRKQ